MNRTLATFHVLERRFGDPSRIRVGSDALAEFMCEAFKAGSPYLDTTIENGSYYRFRGRPVEFDPALVPWEVAWDMPRVARPLPPKVVSSYPALPLIGGYAFVVVDGVCQWREVVDTCP